jgi:SAM-dependent methyltransferase
MSESSSYFLAPASYHDGSFATQKSDRTMAVLEQAGIADATCVLDVGCGAGQTLRLVAALNPTALLIGIDPDEGAWRGSTHSSRLNLLKGEGERLPLADGSVSHALCRVAINYMHQAQALGELTRVLAPGGKLVLSFIGFGYSLRETLQSGPGGFRQRLGNLKDLLAGITLQMVGFQGNRGTFWGRSVPYTARGWLRRQLRSRNCAISWLDCEGRFMGWGTIWWAIIAKKA